MAKGKPYPKFVKEYHAKVLKARRLAKLAQLPNRHYCLKVGGKDG